MESLSLLIKPTSGLCNMRCKYCFYADVADAREVKSYGMMSLETLETLVRKALAETTRACAFGFQGGEPTLAGLDFYKALVDMQKRFNINHVKISNAIQTNGIVIDGEWAKFLAENDFLVGLSIDGGKDIHDALRLSADKKGTHSACMRAAKIFAENSVRFNILSVLTKQLAARPDKAYQFYKKHGFDFVQFIPCIDGLYEAHGSNAYSLDAKAFGKFMCRVFDLWYADFTGGHYTSIRAFDNYVHMLMGLPPESCAMSGFCSPYALVEADGGVYPCDFYVLDQYRLGDISTDSFESMLTGEKAERFAAPSQILSEGCTSCEFLPICRGGCRRDREPFEGGNPPPNCYCAGFKMFFSHSLPRLRMLAQKLTSG